MYYEFNPLFLLFSSYAFGVLLELLMKMIGIHEKFENQNFISDQLTRELGVLKLGWLIRHSFMGMFNPKLKLKGKFSREKLIELKQDMTGAEVSHLFGFISLLIFSLFLPIWEIDWWYIVVLNLINIIFNLYLVFLQQYNKRRIDKLLKLSLNNK